jgi:hypothetical protein
MNIAHNNTKLKNIHWDFKSLWTIDSKTRVATEIWFKSINQDELVQQLKHSRKLKTLQMLDNNNKE